MWRSPIPDVCLRAPCTNFQLLHVILGKPLLRLNLITLDKRYSIPRHVPVPAHHKQLMMKAASWTHLHLLGRCWILFSILIKMYAIVNEGGTQYRLKLEGIVNDVKITHDLHSLPVMQRQQAIPRTPL